MPGRLVSRIKNELVAPGRRPRTVLSGAFKGLHLELDLQHESQVYLGLYERELHAWLRRMANGIATAIDVGAGSGLYALYFLARTSARRVHAFEPDPGARQLLCANVRLNSVDARLHTSSKSIGAGGDTQTTALDVFFEEVELPALVKVDVEGHEAEVLRGASRLLQRGGVRWIVETHSQTLELECQRMLQDHGLSVCVVPQAWWRAALPEERPISHNRWLVASNGGSR